MGIAEILTIIFAVAKIMGKLDFTWFQVFLPMIIAYSFIAFAFFGAWIIAFLNK